MRKDGYKEHETVIEKYDSPNKDLLLGGTDRTIASLFLFTHVTCEAVEQDCGSEDALTKIVQFTEPIIDERSTVVQ